MRTTIDLPEDLHNLARHLAHDTGRSVSQVVTDLIRAGLSPRSSEPSRSVRGLPIASVGRVVTIEDVRRLDDE